MSDVKSLCAFRMGVVSKRLAVVVIKHSSGSHIRDICHIEHVRQFGPSIRFDTQFCVLAQREGQDITSSHAETESFRVA